MSLWLKKARILAQSIIESEEVRASIQQRLIRGELSEDLELLLFQLAYPPVRERVRPIEPLSAESKRNLTLAFAVTDKRSLHPSEDTAESEQLLALKGQEHS